MQSPYAYIVDFAFVNTVGLHCDSALQREKKPDDKERQDPQIVFDQDHIQLKYFNFCCSEAQLFFLPRKLFSSMADVYATLRNNNMPAICFKPTVCKGSISLSSVEYLDLTDAAPDLVLCHNACTPKSNFPSYGTRCTVFVLLSLSNDSFGLAHLPVIVVSAVRFNREKLLHALSELLNTTIKETAYLESCVLTSIETDHSAINISRVIDHSDEFDDEQVAVVFPPLAVGDLASVDKSVSGTVFTTQVSISRLSCVNNIYCYTCHNTEISSVLEEFSCLRVIPL